MSQVGSPLKFTTAHFNTGIDSAEKTIVTSSGPFVVTWDFTKVKNGKYDAYHIKRYADEVKADNFKFGTDNNVIVALPHDGRLISRSED